MNKIYRIAVVGSVFSAIKKRSAYVIADTKQEAVEYLKPNLKEGYSIGNIYLLGEAISGRLFLSADKRPLYKRLTSSK